MNLPGMDRAPENPFEWQQLPTPMPDGVDLGSKADLIAALKSEGFLDSAATCHLPNIPQRAQPRIFASLLHVARTFPEPFLLDPLIDLSVRVFKDNTTVGEFNKRKNSFFFNPNHRRFEQSRTEGWGDNAWERFTNYLSGIVVHEGTHKLRNQQSTMDHAFVDQAITDAVGDSRAPYPNAYGNVRDWFRATFGEYGAENLEERDAMAMQFHAHGFRHPYSDAIFKAYKTLHGTQRLVENRPTSQARERQQATPKLTPIRVGAATLGSASRERGQVLVCSDFDAYYVRTGKHRYQLANGTLTDVDASIREGRLVSVDLGTNKGIVLEVGVPLTRNDLGYLPDEFVGGSITEAVAVRRSGMLSAPKGQVSSTPLSTDLVSSIHRDLYAVKANRFRPVPSSQAWPGLMQKEKEHSLVWEVPFGENASGVTALLPHAKNVTIRSSLGFDVHVELATGQARTSGSDAQGRLVNDSFPVDITATLLDVESGSGLALVDRNTGTSYDYGRAVRIVAVEHSPVPSAQFEASLQPATVDKSAGAFLL